MFYYEREMNNMTAIYGRFIFSAKGLFMSKLESKFQSELIKEIKTRFPGCIVMKTNPGYIQGIPDLMVVYGEHWFSLECKDSPDAPKRPNQEYYVNKMNEMSFSRFIFPENKEEVLNEIQQAFGL